MLPTGACYPKYQPRTAFKNPNHSRSWTRLQISTQACLRDLTLSKSNFMPTSKPCKAEAPCLPKIRETLKGKAQISRALQSRLRLESKSVPLKRRRQCPGWVSFRGSQTRSIISRYMTQAKTSGSFLTTWHSKILGRLQLWKLRAWWTSCKNLFQG